VDATKTSSQETLLLTAVEQVGKALDTMQDLLARLEHELQSQRQRQPAAVLALVPEAAGED